jgi:hypothetical protein
MPDAPQGVAGILLVMALAARGYRVAHANDARSVGSLALSTAPLQISACPSDSAVDKASGGAPSSGPLLW